MIISYKHSYFSEQILLTNNNGSSREKMQLPLGGCKVLLFFSHHPTGKINGESALIQKS